MASLSEIDAMKASLRGLGAQSKLHNERYVNPDPKAWYIVELIMEQG